MEFIRKARAVHGWKYGYGKVVYKNNKTKVIIVCAKHGDFEQTSDHHVNGRQRCKICAGNDSKTAEENFRKRIQELGGAVIGEYRGNNTPVDCICSEGHPCRPLPSNIRKRQGMCKICAGKDPKTAEENFRKRIGEELGGVVIGEYRGNNTPVECICPKGHPCRPRPGDIQKGCGMCKICAGNDSKTAEENFRKRIEEELGGVVIGEYRGKNTPVDCICPKGHPCRPLPSNIQQGCGMCNQCMFCPSCGLWRTRGKLCVYCRPKSENKMYAKTKEMTVVKFLREKLPEHNFIHNRSVGTECTGGHLFPDIRFDQEWYNLIVEIDEHKHRGTDYKCDKQRMYDIIAKLGTPCIFIRYNPDAKSSCLISLLEITQKYLEIPQENFPWNDFGYHAEYLFY